MAWFFALSTVFSGPKQGRRGSAGPCSQASCPQRHRVKKLPVERLGPILARVLRFALHRPKSTPHAPSALRLSGGRSTEPPDAMPGRFCCAVRWWTLSTHRASCHLPGHLGRCSNGRTSARGTAQNQGRSRYVYEDHPHIKHDSTLTFGAEGGLGVVVVQEENALYAVVVSAAACGIY